MRRKVVLAVVLCSTAALAQSVNSDLKSGKRQIGSLVLMPVQVTLNKLGMKGPEEMMEQSREAEVPLAMEVSAALRKQGYSVDHATFSLKELGKDEGLRDLIDDVQKRFDLELQLMQKKAKDVRKGRFSLGDSVARLPLRETADALLFVRANGRVLTDSKKAFGMFIAGPSGDQSLITLAIVDAQNGEVLYFAKIKMAEDFSYEVEQLATRLAQAFADLPRPRSSSQASGKADQQPPDSVPAPESAAASSAVANGGPPRRVRVSHVVLQPFLVKAVRAEYPGIAASTLAQGDVPMRVVIDRNGQIAEEKALSGPIQLIPAATAAVKQWRYRPLTWNGEVFEAETEITFTFKFGP